MNKSRRELSKTTIQSLVFPLQAENSDVGGVITGTGTVVLLERDGISVVVLWKYCLGGCVVCFICC